MNTTPDPGDRPANSSGDSGKSSTPAGKSGVTSGKKKPGKTPAKSGKSTGSGLQKGAFGKSGSGKGGRHKDSRRTNKLTPSLSRLLSFLQVSHLEGLSLIHFRDVDDNREYKRPNEVKVDFVENRILRSDSHPDWLVSADEAGGMTLADLRKKYPEKVSELEAQLAQDRLTEAFFMGRGDRPDLVQSYWFGDAGAGFVSLRDGHPGTAISLPGQQWEKLIREADTVRHEWVDSKGKIRKSTALQEALRKGQTFDEHGFLPKMSGQLRKAYARMPPWLARIAAKELTPTELREVVEAVAIAFSKKTGYRVLAANIHRESDYDLHIHLVFTGLVMEERVEEPYKPATLERMLRDLRNGPAKEFLIQSGNLKPSKAEKEAQLERMFAAGELEDPRKVGTIREYHRKKKPKGAIKRMNAMGPGYVSKTWLWEVSGRSPKVAAVNEQKFHFTSFRGVVIEAAKRDIAPLNAKGPEDVYIDYWLSRQWSKKVEARLSPAGKKEVAREAQLSVDRYIDAGRSLPEPFSAKDLDLRERKLREAEEARATAVRAEKNAKAAQKAAESAQAAVDRIVQEALVPPTLEEVAEKMKFKQEPDAVGLFRTVEGGLYPERLVITGRTFVRSQPTRGMATPETGEGAVALLATEDTWKPVKRSKLEILGQLVKWFPAKAIAIVTEALGDRGGDVLKGLLQLDRVPRKAPAKKTGKKKDDAPDDGGSPELQD